MNKKFFDLPVEKQERILNAAYEVFAHSSYKDVSMSRIADAGNISKSLLFHYFRNKQELYMYLWEMVSRIALDMEAKQYKKTSDFFEIISQKILARCEFMRMEPAKYLFSLRALFEENPEIREAIGKAYKKTYENGANEMLEPVDTSSFRPGVDVRMLSEEIDGYLLGCLWHMFSVGKLEPDRLEEDFLKRIEQWKAAYLKQVK